LKDLEVKVSELEKASDATNHENGLLRAQVQRLQMELREYRKRLSLNSTTVNRTPPAAGGLGSLLGGSGSTNSSFQFEFPRFGGLPGAHLVDNGPLAKSGIKSTSTSFTTNAPVRQDSTIRSLSPRSQTNGSISQSPMEMTNTNALNGAQNSSNLNGLFDQFDYSTMTSSAAKPSRSSTSNTDSSTPQSRVFQFNSGSSSHSSPSSASISQVGQNSSCDTSPEPSHNSPNNPDTIADGYVCHGNSEGEITFCEKLNMACGNPRNPIPRAMSQSDVNPSPAAPAKSPAPAPLNGIDFFANQNGGQFDPTLFGDYRESQNAIIGDGEFTGGFFNDAFPMADFGSPFHFGDTPAVQKSNPLEDIEKLQDGDDEVVPGEDPSMMLNCHKIW
jgi:AP-1-like factor